MISGFHLFRALNPDDRYPTTPFNIKLKDLRYHLPLPPPVGDHLADLLSSKGPFLCLERYCNPAGIDLLRSNPAGFEIGSGMPSYAESEIRVEAIQDGRVMGYIMQQAATNALAAQEILRFAIEDWASHQGSIAFAGSEHEAAIEWVMQYGTFFQHCGGFEMVRISYYFNADEQNAAYSMIDGDFSDPMPSELKEDHQRFALFRDLLERSRKCPTAREHHAPR